MKKGIIIGLVVLVIGAICFLGLRNNGVEYETADAIYPASADNGWIEEKVIGDAESASVVVYEYADFGCSHCAEFNKRLNDLMEKYEGEIAVVFRSFDLGAFLNSPAAARAATAAGMQGYFKEYKDLLFLNQAEWMYAERSEISDLLVSYFREVSEGMGDEEKFLGDMKSEAVKKRLNFERVMGKKVELRGTPMFRIDGETVEAGELVKVIEERIDG